MSTSCNNLVKGTKERSTEDKTKNSNRISYKRESDEQQKIRE